MHSLNHTISTFMLLFTMHGGIMFTTTNCQLIVHHVEVLAQLIYRQHHTRTHIPVIYTLISDKYLASATSYSFTKKTTFFLLIMIMKQHSSYIFYCNQDIRTAEIEMGEWRMTRLDREYLHVYFLYHIQRALFICQK